MQCKDIPDLPVLQFLASHPRWGTWIGVGNDGSGELFDNSVQHGMPQGVPDKLALAKMRGLIRRGLVDGCGCGCRGDFVITDKGRAAIDPPPTPP